MTEIFRANPSTSDNCRLMARSDSVCNATALSSVKVFCRIDYHLATAGMAALARSKHIYKDVKFSDHAPITVDYDFKL